MNTTAATICLHVTITKAGQTRYAKFNHRAMRTFPLARAKAEAMIADGTAYVYEIRDYATGDGSPVRASAIDAAAVN